MENKTLLTDLQVYAIRCLLIDNVVMYGRNIVVRLSTNTTITKFKTVKLDGLFRRKTTHLKQNRLRGQGPVRNSWRCFCVSLGKILVQ